MNQPATLTPPSQLAPRLLTWNWEELLIDLISLSETERSRVMASHLVEGLRAQALFLGRAGVLRELAFIVLALVDTEFPPEGRSMT